MVIGAGYVARQGEARYGSARALAENGASGSTSMCPPRVLAALTIQRFLWRRRRTHHCDLMVPATPARSFKVVEPATGDTFFFDGFLLALNFLSYPYFQHPVTRRVLLNVEVGRLCRILKATYPIHQHLVLQSYRHRWVLQRVLFERETRAVIVDGEVQRLLRRVLLCLDRTMPPPAPGEPPRPLPPSVWDPNMDTMSEDDSDSDDTETDDDHHQGGGKVTRLLHTIGSQVRYLAYQDNDAGRALLHRVRAVWLQSPQHTRAPQRLVVKEGLDRIEMQVQNMPKRTLPDWVILRWLEDFRESLDRWYV